MKKLLIDFDQQVSAKNNDSVVGIWELPDDMLDLVSGGPDFSQAGPGGADFMQCGGGCDFGQNIGDFSQGTPPGDSQIAQ